MKKRIFIASILLSLIFLMPCVFANPDITITSGGQTPNPAKIGGTFKLLINVGNAGTETAKDVSCSIDLKYGLALASGSNTLSISSLDAGEAKTLEYAISVDNDAAPGTHIVAMDCIESGKGVVSKNIEAEVETKYGSLNIADVRTEPSIVEPGQKAILYMTLENTADYLMNNINIKLNLSDLKIAPYGESSEKKIRSVGAHTSQDVTFSIVALPEISGGIYKIPLEMEYDDVTTKGYEVSSYISLEIGSSPKIDASVDSSDIYGSKTTGTITIKLTNRGLTDLKFMNVVLNKGNRYDILSADSVYIGDVDSNDYETAEFNVKVDKKETILPLTLEFRDSSNRLYTEQKNITFRKLSSAEAGKSGISMWMILIVLAIGAYFYYQYRKKKKQ